MCWSRCGRGTAKRGSDEALGPVREAGGRVAAGRAIDDACRSGLHVGGDLVDPARKWREVGRIEVEVVRVFVVRLQRIAGKRGERRIDRDVRQQGPCREIQLRATESHDARRGVLHGLAREVLQRDLGQRRRAAGAARSARRSCTAPARRGRPAAGADAAPLPAGGADLSDAARPQSGDHEGREGHRTLQGRTQSLHRGFRAGDCRLFPRKWPARARCWSAARSILTRGC